jgi:hypothetical protein
MDSFLIYVGKTVCDAARGIEFISFFGRYCVRNITGSAFDAFYVPNYLQVGTATMGVVIVLIAAAVLGRKDSSSP